MDLNLKMTVERSKRRSYFLSLMFITKCFSKNLLLRIISKLRYYLSARQLTQICYNLIYPYISYGILAWGSVYKTHISKIQVKQNHIVRLIFFATAFGCETESAK